MTSAVTFYQSGRAKKLKTLPQILVQQTVNAVRRGTRIVRNEIHSEYTARGLGRALLEGRGTRILGGSALATIIKAGRTKAEKDGNVTSGVYLKGTAAMVAQGGKTKSHDIKPSLDTYRAGGIFSIAKTQQHFKDFFGGHRAGERGAFERLRSVLSSGKGGKFIASGTVHHPGSHFKRDGFIDRGEARALPKFRAEIENGKNKVAEIVNRG